MATQHAISGASAQSPLSQLRELVLTHEDWLIDRVLMYAMQRNYVRYTSTLKEAWRISIAGLSFALMHALEEFQHTPELGPDDDYAADSIASFGILEAQRHRKRGVTLPMFFGLMKYYRQAYQDLIQQTNLEPAWQEQCRTFIDRCFDRIEIGFCTEWMGLSTEEKLTELQDSNRTMTNEKNKYLTIFESLHAPVILLNDNNGIENMNHAAASLVAGAAVPGSTYYGTSASETLPWLHEEIDSFLLSGREEVVFTKDIRTRQGKRHFSVTLKRMLDVSHKFSGTVLMFNDLTSQKRLEKRLRNMAITDSLTGIFSRGWYLNLTEQEIRRCRRYGTPMFIVMIDVDHFKAINDNHGHQVGDQVLQKVGALLQQQVRKADVVGRIGGEEFAITMVAASSTQAAATAERLRKMIARCRVAVEKDSVCFTISAGIAQLNAEEDSLEAIMRRADQALYVAKNEGRNRVRIAA